MLFAFLLGVAIGGAMSFVVVFDYFQNKMDE